MRDNIVSHMSTNHSYYCNANANLKQGNDFFLYLLLACRELLMLPEKICRCEHVLEFFRPRPEDLREEYPPVEKITNLYGEPLK